MAWPTYVLVVPSQLELAGAGCCLVELLRFALGQALQGMALAVLTMCTQTSHVKNTCNTSLAIINMSQMHVLNPTHADKSKYMCERIVRTTYPSTGNNFPHMHIVSELCNCACILAQD